LLELHYLIKSNHDLFKVKKWQCLAILFLSGGNPGTATPNGPRPAASGPEFSQVILTPGG
jgi:hypothetical protein